MEVHTFYVKCIIRDVIKGDKDLFMLKVDIEVTLKRFDVQGNKLILIPKNKDYSPIVVSLR